MYAHWHELSEPDSFVEHQTCAGSSRDNWIQSNLNSGSIVMNIAHRFAYFMVAFMILALTACAPTAKREGTGEFIDDAVITSKVKAAFAADPQVKATEVKVTTFKGVVQLSGFVDSRASAERAVQLAREVKGVKDVVNNMVIK
jgi:hypothetical protein